MKKPTIAELTEALKKVNEQHKMACEQYEGIYTDYRKAMGFNMDLKSELKHANKRIDALVDTLLNLSKK